MRGFRFTVMVIVITLVMAINYEMTMDVMAKGYLGMGLYCESNEIDINETDEPLIFNGWLNYTGISVTPLRVYLYASASLGEPVLTESEFVFHIPANETFIVYIYIETIKGNGSPGQLLLDSSFEQGPTTGQGPSIMADYLIINSSQKENMTKVQITNPRNNDLQAFGYLGIVSILIFVYSFTRRKFNKTRLKNAL